MIRAKQPTTEKGFTLIEMLVSLSIFSIVLVVILGSIITIVDVNRKAQSLTIVMNDINFAMESIVRSIKTGQLDGEHLVDTSSSIKAPTILKVTNQNRELVEYSLDTSDGIGKVMRTITPEGGTRQDPMSLTSNQINVEELKFYIYYGDDNKQPRVLLLMSGVVQTGPSIESEFKVQTSVSPRRLDNYYVQNAPNP